MGLGSLTAQRFHVFTTEHLYFSILNCNLFFSKLKLSQFIISPVSAVKTSASMSHSIFSTVDGVHGLMRAFTQAYISHRLM